MQGRLWVPAALLAVAGSCSAQEAWRGVWEGTLGQQAVRVCLDGKEGIESRYYYLKYGLDIPLRKSEAPVGNWLEGDDDKHPGGSWQLANDGNDALRGAWQHPRSGKQLPVVLKRTAATAGEDSNLCEATQFFKPVVDAIKLVPGPVQGSGRHKYQALSPGFQKRGAPNGSEPSGIMVLGLGAGSEALNKILQQRLRERMARGRDTRLGGLADSGEEVTWLSERWLTLREMEWPRGYGISSISVWYETWDLSTATKVDLMRWFNARGGTWHEENGNDGMEQVFKPSRALAKAIGPGDDNGGDPECKAQEKSWGRPRLAEGGIEFEQGNGPCQNFATLSYKAMQPFLNEEGRRQVEALQRETARP